MDIKQKNKQQIVIFYNQLINFFWTILAFAPIVYFCYQYLPLNLLYWFICISCPVLFIPASWLARFRLSSSQSAYKKIGVRFIKKYTQDGDHVNRVIKSRYPEYKYVESRQSLKKVMGKTYVNEKFHYLVFIFFLCLSIYAFLQGLAGWGIFISLANIVYNLYPIFLQQYNRIRINLLMRRQNES